MKKSILGIIFLLQCGLVHAAAALYYVAPGGSGWDCGGSVATACDNISTVVNNTSADEVTIRLATGTYTDAFIVNANDFSVLNVSGGWNTDFTSQNCQATLTELQTMENSAAMDASAPALSSLDVDLSCFTIKSVLPTGRRGLDLNIQGGSLSLMMREMIFESIAGSAISIYTSTSGLLEAGLEKTIFRNAYQPDGEAKWSGGAIYSYAYGGSTQTIRLENALLYNNNSLKGAAISIGALDTASSINLTLTNSTLSGNNSIGPDIGGAINVVATVTSQAIVNLKNSIVWGNQNDGVARDLVLFDSDSGEAIVNASYSDVGERYLFENSGAYNDNGSNLNIDPRLDSRYRLTDLSPVSDRAQCGYKLLNVYQRVAPYDDIDNEPRPGFGVLSGCDMGADEAPNSFCVPFKAPNGKAGVFCL